MRWRVAGIAGMVMILAGCGSSRPVLGDAVMGPDGWLEYCQRHPEDRANRPIDILTVTEELRSLGVIEGAGGAYYVTSLTNKVGSTLT